MGDDLAERLVVGHFNSEKMPFSVVERPPRPQDDAVRVGIAGCDALGIEIALFAPIGPRGTSTATPCERGADCGRSLHEVAPADPHLWSFPKQGLVWCQRC